MRALVLDRGGLAVRDVPAPEPAEGEVVIRVRACAVCQSDLHLIRDQGAAGTDGGAHILGHELAGDVVAAGAGVSGQPPGTRVTARPLASCGRCAACRRGLIRACPDRTVVGFTRPGAFAEYVAVPASAVYPLPDGLDYEVAALAEPLACAYNAAMAADVQPGDWAVVIGPGPLGLLATRVLKLRGARVLVAGTREERLAAARGGGADATCNVRSESLEAAVRAHAGELGADAALEMVGSSEALAQALSVTRLRGRIVLAGEPRPGVTFPLEPHRLFFREHQIVASLGAGESFPRVLQLLAGRLVDGAALVTHRFPLDRATEAFAVAAERRDRALKVLVRPGRPNDRGEAGEAVGAHAA